MSSQRWMASVAILFGAYIVVRAIQLPLTQDEANSFWWYVMSGRFLPLDSHLDAGNHHLSSLFGWLGYSLFGAEFIALRIGSVLAYVLYAFALVRMVAFMGSELVRWCAFLALLMCPFLFEYFGLFRGYGLSVAFFMWALFQFIQLMRTGAQRHVFLLAIALTLSVCANLSMLPLNLVMLLAGVLMRWRSADGPRRMRQRVLLAGVILLVLLVFGLAAKVSLQLKDAGLLYLGSNEGLIKVSVSSLCKVVFHSPLDLLPDLMVAMAIISVVVAGWWVGRTHTLAHPVVLITSLLWLESMIRSGMHHVLDVNFPEDRAAFQLLVLFLLAVPFAIDALGSVKAPFRSLALTLLVIPYLTLSDLNLEEVTNNGQQSIPQRFIQYAAVRQQELGRPLVAANGRQLRTNWGFGQFKDQAMLQDPEDQLFDEPAQDLRVVPYVDIAEALPGYRIVDSTQAKVMYLLEREEPLRLGLVLDSLWSSAILSHNGFNNVLDIDGERFGRQQIYVRATGRLKRERDHGEQWFAAVENSIDGRVHEDGTDLMRMRTQWSGETFDIMRRMPGRPGMTRRVCFFWNTSEEPALISGLRLRVYVDSSDVLP